MSHRVFSSTSACLVALVLCLPKGALALDILVGGESYYQPRDERIWLLSGDIVAGDLKRFIARTEKQGKLPEFVMLDSPGGNINEAMNIALYLKQKKVAYQSGLDLYGEPRPTTCSSACSLIFLALDERRITPDSVSRIGVHRPFFESTYRAKLTLAQAAEQYVRAEHTIRNFLGSMTVPQPVVDVMFDTPHTRTRYYIDRDLDALTRGDVVIGQDSPESCESQAHADTRERNDAIGYPLFSDAANSTCRERSIRNRLTSRNWLN